MYLNRSDAVAKIKQLLKKYFETIDNSMKQVIGEQKLKLNNVSYFSFNGIESHYGNWGLCTVKCHKRLNDYIIMYFGIYNADYKLIKDLPYNASC